MLWWEQRWWLCWGDMHSWGEPWEWTGWGWWNEMKGADSTGMPVMHITGCVSLTSIKSWFSWTRFNIDCRFEPSSSHNRLHQRKTPLSWHGSAEPRWLYVLDVDWSDLIEISDVTRTVYISFDTQEQVANVFSQLSTMFFFALILWLSHYHGGEIWGWSDSTVTHSLLLKVNKIKITVITHSIAPTKLCSIRAAVMH